MGRAQGAATARVPDGGRRRELHGDAPGRVRTRTAKGSPKLRRLSEIVGEAADGGRKVIVFSYFRDVLRR